MWTTKVANDWKHCRLVHHILTITDLNPPHNHFRHQQASSDE